MPPPRPGSPEWFELRRRMLLMGQDPGPLQGLGGEQPMFGPPPMGPGVPPVPMPPDGAPPMGPGTMPPPPGMGMGGAAPPGPGMPPPPMGGAPVPPGPGMMPQAPPMPPGGAPPMGPGIASYGARPAQPAHPAWFPGPPVPKPRPPPRRRSAVEELGERMGQPSAPTVPAHEPEAARVPQPVGLESGYDPGAAYAGAKGSTREMPRDTSFGSSSNLMDWISARMGWR